MSSNNTSRQRKGMWQKLKEKKAVEREHESNFTAGRIPIHERHLHRTGIRGRKRYIYYAFIYILGIVCFINLVMLCIMLSVLRIDKSGMESLSLFKSGLVRWMYGGDLQNVVLKTGEIGAFQGRNLNIMGNNGAAQFVHVAPGRNATYASVGPDHTLLQAKSGVRIVSSEIDKTILHITEREVVWNVPAKPVNLDTNYVVSHRITSDHDKNLNIKPGKTVTIRGNENVFVDSGKLNLKTENSITLSVGGKEDKMTFKGSEYHFPNVPKSNSSSGDVKNYRLCICTNKKTLFKIDASTGHMCKNAEACLS